MSLESAYSPYLDYAPHLKPYLEDGRSPIEQLYGAYHRLKKDYGWEETLIHEQIITSGLPNGESAIFPIYGYNTPYIGKINKSLWVISGVHGEEPPGPNAIAQEIESLGKLGQDIPMVILPLCNPGGYFRGWRYQNEYRDHRTGLTVTDPDHLLIEPEDPHKPRKEYPTSQAAKDFMQFVTSLLVTHPPHVSIDLHEDEALPMSYIYSQGRFGTNDPVAQEIIRIMIESGMPIQMEGLTRFDEVVNNGVVHMNKDGSPIRDGSIDEFLSAEKIFMKGQTLHKPAAQTVIVVETPPIGTALPQRIFANRNILRSLPHLWQIAL